MEIANTANVRCSELELRQQVTWRDNFADVARESFNSFKDFSDAE